MRTKVLFIYIAVILLAACKQQQQTDTIHPKMLMVDGFENPMGNDTPQPQLSWKLVSKQRGQKQTAYRIIVASNLDNLQSNIGDIWDSQKVTSEQSVNVIYKGKKLLSGMQCFWKVKVWDKDAHESEWSIPGLWTVGLLYPVDWTGLWIAAKTDAAATLFTNEITIEKPINRAIAYICSPKPLELYVNGSKTNDYTFLPSYIPCPGLTYFTYDVSHFLKEGKNSVSAIIYNYLINNNIPNVDSLIPVRFIFQLNIHYSNGTTESFASNANWKYFTETPISINTDGCNESYDARKELPGWNMPGFNTSQWLPVDTLPYPELELKAPKTIQHHVNEVVKAIKIIKTDQSTYLFDFGQKIMGRPKLKLKGSVGTTVKLRLYTSLENTNKYEAQYSFTLKGEGIEEYAPHLACKAFRYVELMGVKNKPPLTAIEAQKIEWGQPAILGFESSNTTINKLFTATAPDCSNTNTTLTRITDSLFNHSFFNVLIDSILKDSANPDIVAENILTNCYTDICEQNKYIILTNDTCSSSFLNTAKHLIFKWIQAKISGINLDSSFNANKDIRLKIHFINDISFVKSSVYTNYGLIISDWSKKGDSLFWNVSIPVNCTAQISLPTNNNATIKENKIPIQQSPDIFLLQQAANECVLKISSGDYFFQCIISK